MLYDRWRSVVQAQGDSVALTDWADGRSWTFRRLAQAAESFEPGESAPWVHPRGSRAEFVLHVLAGWRLGRVVCPLETGQSVPPWPAPPTPAAHFKLTSGSTGQPRGIWFTGEQLAADAAQIVSTMGLRPEWPNLGVISLAHSYGFSNLVLPLLLHGIPLFLAPAPLPEIVRRAGNELGPLTLPSVPVLWANWNEAGAIPGDTRLAISAGAPLPLPVEEAIFLRRGLKVHNFYGASECGGIAYDATDEPRTDIHYTGRAMEGVRLECGGEGCLIVHTPAAGSGYWPEPGSSLAPGRFLTSDLVRLRPEGAYLVGRSVDTINVAGRKVHPDQVETVLRQHPQVRDCVVFGAPCAAGASVARGDTIVAWVVPERGVSETELREFAVARLAAWQVPERFLVREKLPVNERGKVSRASLREQFAEALAGSAT